jgi:hypothetical protein
MGKAALERKATVGRSKRVKAKPVADLTVNRQSAAFKVAAEAHAKGKRVNTKGMTREEFIKSLLTK